MVFHKNMGDNTDHWLQILSFSKIFGPVSLQEVRSSIVGCPELIDAALLDVKGVLLHNN